MTVTNRRKRGDIRTPCLSIACNSTSKRNVSECNFSTSSDLCCTKNVVEDCSPMTLPTPEDSTASWLDADDSYQVGDFLDEASRILHNEENYTDACHERLRFEYEQWKRIPHLRIIGKRIGCLHEKTLDDHQRNCQIISGQKNSNNGDSDLLRDQVIKIMTEKLWQRLLDKTSTKIVCQKQSASEPRRHSSRRIESALTVSPILPVNRPPMVIKSRTHLETIHQSKPMCHGQNSAIHNKKTWPKDSVNVLPPIEIHQKKTADKSKRWFSAISMPGRNQMLPRPVTSVTRVDTAINVRFDISIDGKSIKSLKKKGKEYCSPS